jgi:hypothetical protein
MPTTAHPQQRYELYTAVRLRDVLQNSRRGHVLVDPCVHALGETDAG